jgi:nitroreductase
MHNDTQSAEAYIAQLLNIPSSLKVESMIAIGYPDEKKRPHTREELQDEKVYFNQYGTRKPE